MEEMRENIGRSDVLIKEKTGADHVVWEKVIPALLLALSICCASLAARWMKGPGSRLLQNSAAGNAIARGTELVRAVDTELLTAQVQFTVAYGLGAADAWIRFENIPRDLATHYLAATTFLPKGADIKRVAFDSGEMHITIETETLQQGEEFRQQLAYSGYFPGVSVSYLGSGDEAHRFMLECVLPQ